jgi:hypothetical protein
VAVATTSDRITSSAPKMAQAHQRMLTAVQGTQSLVLTALGRQASSFEAAITCDAQQAMELDQVRACFNEIIALGHSGSVNWARVGLVHHGRAEAWDRTRDEHISMGARIGAAVQRGLLRAARAIERALTGRSE